MSDPKKSISTAKAAEITKPQENPTPRRVRKTTPVVERKIEVELAVAAAPVADSSPVTPVVPAKAQPTRKPSRVDETVAKHQKVLADALLKAQAIKYDQPVVVNAEAQKADKNEKPARQKKKKLVRDSYAMPEDEYAKIGGLKKRLAGLRHNTKKSELLRAGVMLLAALNDVELVAVMGRIERIKTGRPAK